MEVEVKKMEKRELREIKSDIETSRLLMTAGPSWVPPTLYSQSMLPVSLHFMLWEIS